MWDDKYKYPGHKVAEVVETVFLNLRRLFYITFRKKYIVKSITKRKGVCKHQGCCKAMIIQCPQFKNCKDCAKYPNFPYICQIYPFDEKDKNWFAKKHCAFHWDDKK